MARQKLKNGYTDDAFFVMRELLELAARFSLPLPTDYATLKLDVAKAQIERSKNKAAALFELRKFKEADEILSRVTKSAKANGVELGEDFYKLSRDTAARLSETPEIQNA